MQRTCRSAGQRAQGPASPRTWGEAAAAVSAQGRRSPCPEREEPMNRYIHPISCPPAAPGTDPALLERMLETLCYQNQLLLDLLAAVNALTAAMLNARGAGQG